MVRSIAEKMMIKAGQRCWLHSPPADFLEHIEAPALQLATRLEGEFEYMHLFARNQAELTLCLPEARDHLAAKGSLWVSWPKGRQRGTDLNLHEVIRTGYALGIVESTCLSINSTWSALKFTEPKRDKVYNNSHANLVRR